ncbi:hypothetical protein H6784_01050 [Candidatus Nomurabacteria bacterium]|nr:hypothetical protein [Candidatus Kaiserbacteria bacterium]MCB9813980.1 hypothetical protein [Candidatus Nomurabacteria bacterium]
MEQPPKKPTSNSEQNPEKITYQTLDEIKASIFTADNGGAIIVGDELFYTTTSKNTTERLRGLENNGFTVEITTRQAEEGVHDVYDIRITKN